jgi:hypothetical protein
LSYLKGLRSTDLKKLKTKAIVVDGKRRRKKTRKTWNTGYTRSKESTIPHGLVKGPTAQPTINQWAHTDLPMLGKGIT